MDEMKYFFFIIAVHFIMLVETISALCLYVHSLLAAHRISELFDIIVEYPDSQPALGELKECLQHCDLREHLVQGLKSS